VIREERETKYPNCGGPHSFLPGITPTSMALLIMILGKPVSVVFSGGKPLTMVLLPQSWRISPPY